MSIEVMTYVWKHSQQKGSALLLLLAIADHAHDDGTGAYPSVETLAAKARMTSRNVQYLLRTLASSKELIIEPGAGPKGANIYSIPLDISGGVKTFQGETQGIRGEIQGMLGVKPVSPKPSGNHQRIIKEVVEVDEPFRARMRTKYEGVLTDLDERIDEALGHDQARKYPNKQLHVQGWLRRDAERLSTFSKNGASNGKHQGNVAPNSGTPLTVYRLPDGPPVLGSKPKTML